MEEVTIEGNGVEIIFRPSHSVVYVRVIFAQHIENNLLIGEQVKEFTLYPKLDSLVRDLHYLLGKTI